MNSVPKSNVMYTFSDDGLYGYGTLKDGTVFVFDADLFDLIKSIKWYLGNKGERRPYIMDKDGRTLHQVLFSIRKGYELDHINLDTLDNRRCNVRFCTHQQNQINQPLQRNNTSGVSGVRYYKARSKFVARIKICQKDIHLGYYVTFEEAVQARNIGMEDWKYNATYSGTPQGGIVSPIFANIYLHELDKFVTELANEFNCKGKNYASKEYEAVRQYGMQFLLRFPLL